MSQKCVEIEEDRVMFGAQAIVLLGVDGPEIHLIKMYVMHITNASCWFYFTLCYSMLKIEVHLHYMCMRFTEIWCDSGSKECHLFNAGRKMKDNFSLQLILHDIYWELLVVELRLLLTFFNFCCKSLKSVHWSWKLKCTSSWWCGWRKFGDCTIGKIIMQALHLWSWAMVLKLIQINLELHFLGLTSWVSLHVVACILLLRACKKCQYGFSVQHPPRSRQLVVFKFVYLVELAYLNISTRVCPSAFFSWPWRGLGGAHFTFYGHINNVMVPFMSMCSTLHEMKAFPPLQIYAGYPNYFATKTHTNIPNQMWYCM